MFVCLLGHLRFRVYALAGGILERRQTSITVELSGIRKAREAFGYHYHVDSQFITDSGNGLEEFCLMTDMLVSINNGLHLALNGVQLLLYGRDNLLPTLGFMLVVFGTHILLLIVQLGLIFLAVGKQQVPVGEQVLERLDILVLH